MIAFDYLVLKGLGYINFLAVVEKKTPYFLVRNPLKNSRFLFYCIVYLR